MVFPDHTHFLIIQAICKNFDNKVIDPKRANMKHDVLNSKEKTAFRQMVGQLNWAVQGSRPDMAFEMISPSIKIKGRNCGRSTESHKSNQ